MSADGIDVARLYCVATAFVRAGAECGMVALRDARSRAHAIGAEDYRRGVIHPPVAIGQWKVLRNAWRDGRRSAHRRARLS